MTKTLEEFCAAVNKLSRDECDKINANKEKHLFGAEHFDMGADYLGLYFDQGMTPEQAYAAIQAESGV